MELNVKSTALVLIDLQNAIVSRTLAPYSGEEVVQKGVQLAQAFHIKGALVVYVHVDMANMLKLPVDEPTSLSAPPPPGASELVSELDIRASDLVVTKRQWGAFFGTNLEEELRKRKIETVVVGGIATNFGVESTARAAAGLGFALVVVEDATTTMDEEAHQFAFKRTFPRLGRVRTTEQVIGALG